MKQKMRDTVTTPSAAQAAVTVTLAAEVQIALPDKSVVAQSLRRYRQACNRRMPATLPALPAAITFEIPKRHHDMVLFDVSLDNDNRIILLGDRDLLDGLKRAKVWVVDGTFKKCAQLFFQIYSIHFEFADGINPVGMICLLPNKSANTYRQMLGSLKQLIPDAQPGIILTDFEKVAMDAFQENYPNSSHRVLFSLVSVCSEKGTRKLVFVHCTMPKMRFDAWFDAYLRWPMYQSRKLWRRLKKLFQPCHNTRAQMSY